MRAGGQITVFLSLILLCVLGLICGLLESARITGARYYLQIAAGSSMDSVMSQYHRPLWDQYRILGLAYTETGAVEKEFMRFLECYAETSNWYPMEPEKVEMQRALHFTDGNGRCLEEEILDYMKYGIWTQGLSPDIAEEIETAVTEAHSVNTVSKELEQQTRAAWEVEKVLSGLEKRLEEQKEYYEAAAYALEQGSGSDFRKAAENLLDCLDSVPGLVQEYEKKADALGRRIEEVKGSYEEKQGDISTSVQRAMDEEFKKYDTYTSEDGERRREVERLAELAEQQQDLVRETMEKAAEAEEIIQNWEPEEESGGLDEDALWEPVRRYFAGYRVLELPCSAGGQDQKSEELLNRLRKGTESGLLQMVLPEGREVSEASLPLSGLPSHERSQEDGNGSDGLPQGVTGLSDKVLYTEYCGSFFGNFCTVQEETFQYGLEYLLYGESVDSTNLRESVKRLLAVREGLNFIAILTDPQKRSEAETLAAAIVGGSGFLPLVGITAFFIMGVWALGESLADVKGLLAGGKIPIWKDADSWTLSLSGLLDLAASGTVPAANTEKGIDYEEYLKIFLMTAPIETTDYRIMDLIQHKLSAEDPEFRMKRCAYQVDMKVEVCGKHIFTALGLWKNALGALKNRYTYGTEIRKAY